MGFKINYINHWEFLEDFPKDRALWGNNGIILNNSKGMGKIKYRYGLDDEDIINFFLLNEEKPILLGKDDGEKTFISLKSNLTKLKEQNRNLFNEISNTITEDLKDKTHLLYEFLNLFEPGIYLVSQVPYSLQDNMFNFYWNLTNSLKEYPSLDFQYLLSRDNILIPSESTAKFNELSVMQYRNSIKNNVKLQGIAYYLGGNTSVLLDGHLKSVACYLEGVPFNALSIIPIKDTVFDYLEDEEFILIGNRPISFSKLQKKTIKLINKYERKAQLLNKDSLKTYLKFKSKVEFDSSLLNYINYNHKEWKKA